MEKLQPGQTPVEAVETVGVNSVKADMVIAKDVITEDGSILIPKGTMLNAVNVAQLRARGVTDIMVAKRSINDNLPNIPNEAPTLEKQKIPVSERQEFKEFAKVYEEKTEDVKRAILAISDGATVNLDELHSLTNGIMDKLTCKSDIFTFIAFIGSSDEHTMTHSNNVALLANLFGHWLGVSEQESIFLTSAGILHDIGKTKIPNEILNKKGKLTDEEFKIMKDHTILGYRILQTQNIPDDIKKAALMHHEKIDGSGYPLGAKDEQICGFAKIISIVDIYDAMTANRVYRKKICPFDVIRQFEVRSYGELDTTYLLSFLKSIAYTYIGNWVELSDGREAEVVFINQSNLSRPMVQLNDGAVINLAETKDISIRNVI